MAVLRALTGVEGARAPAPRSEPGDGRSYVLRLAAAGRAAHLAAVECFVPVLGEVVTSLGRREPTVRRALADLRVALDELDDRHD